MSLTKQRVFFDTQTSLGNNTQAILQLLHLLEVVTRVKIRDRVRLDGISRLNVCNQSRDVDGHRQRGDHLFCHDIVTQEVPIWLQLIDFFPEKSLQRPVFLDLNGPLSSNRVR